MEAAKEKVSFVFLSRNQYDKINISIQPCAIFLSVDIKRARNLPAEDHNGEITYKQAVLFLSRIFCVFRFPLKGLSDPYCKISIVNIPDDQENSNMLSISPSPASPIVSPSIQKRNPSLFSCVRSSRKFNLNFPCDIIFSRDYFEF